MSQTAENKRLEEESAEIPWKKWGPYLSERQWGAVREDYSLDGNAWKSFPHEHARSRVYHWGEDGIAGFSDVKQRLCFGLAFWNERDPFLKERLFGLTPLEGAHGADVKEYYFYLDSTPTYTYMKFLYKYPQAEYPYAKLVEEHIKNPLLSREYTLLDTGVFDRNAYFDIFIEYAKASPEDILIKISAYNRGPEAKPLHILPTYWWRNTWSWWNEPQKPSLESISSKNDSQAIKARHAQLGSYVLYFEDSPPLLFVENETNTEKIYGMPNASPYVKDSIHEYIVNGKTTAVNPNLIGTKASAHYHHIIPAGAAFSFF